MFIASIEFIKELCQIAKETVQAEKELESLILEKTPKTALTELFLELKSDKTPAVVERIVDDIDSIYRNSSTTHTSKCNNRIGYSFRSCLPLLTSRSKFI